MSFCVASVLISLIKIVEWALSHVKQRAQSSGTSSDTDDPLLDLCYLSMTQLLCLSFSFTCKIQKVVTGRLSTTIGSAKDRRRVRPSRFFPGTPYSSVSMSVTTTPESVWRTAAYAPLFSSFTPMEEILCPPMMTLVSWLEAENWSNSCRRRSIS
jgi:hypothetical protein